MSAPTDNDFNTFYSISNYEKFQVIQEYLWNDNVMDDVAEFVFPNDPAMSAKMKVSAITRCYGLGGQNHGIFKRWGIAQQVQDSDIKAFVEAYPDGCNYDKIGSEMKRFLIQRIKMRTQARESTARPRQIESGTSFVGTAGGGVSRVNNITQEMPDWTGPVSSGHGSRTYSGRRIKVGPILVVLVVILLFGGSSILRSGKLFVGKVNSFLSSDYEAEIFEYEGVQYLGNQRFNKPDGVCMQLNGQNYTLGYFEGSKLDGYGVVVKDQGDILDIGSFKNSVLDGWGIHRGNGVIYVAKFKKGAPTGYGYRYENGKEQLVKFESAKAGHIWYEDSLKVIAERGGGSWYKENGKELKVRNDTYKDITYLREGLIRIDDVEYYFDSEGEAFYDGEEVQLSWDVNDCMYDSVLEDDEGTRLIYTFGEGIQGWHQYETKEGLKTQTFSAQVS